jgi:gamma-tubulin complex component 2
MFHFVHNLYYYMAIEVIQPKWHEMIDELKKAATVDEVVKIHGDFLDGCLRECLLTNHELIKVPVDFPHTCSMFSLLRICEPGPRRP